MARALIEHPVIFGALEILVLNKNSSPDQKRGSSKSPDNVSQSGYPTNFGTGLGGGAVRGVEGQVVSAIFKALVSRFVRSSKEVKSSEAVVSHSRESNLEVQIYFTV